MLARLCDVVVRRRRVLFAAWWLHVWLLHYLVLGYMSWDGFNYRVVPVIELLKHGGTGTDRFTDWALVGHIPFIELAHAPFIALFGLRGLLIGFPLVVFPLCVLAVYCCVRELTGSERSGTFGAIAYCAMPMINQQPFTGLVDFAVCGLLAFFVYAVLRKRPVLLAIAAFAFTMSRPQTLYVAVVLGPVLAIALRLRGRELALLATALALGCAPAIGVQIYKWVTYGSPIYPAELQVLGITIGHGVPMADYWKFAGLPDGSLGSLLVSAVHGWLFHPIWPIGGFYVSGSMGAGLVFVVAVLLLPLYFRSGATRVERLLLGASLVLSLIAKDFALPRYAYAVTLGTCIVFGRAVPALLASHRRWLAAMLVVLAAHALRPEFDLIQLQSGFLSPRMNASGSPWYARGGNVYLYPDRHLQLVIVDAVRFIVPLYGRGLTNEVLASIPGDELGPACTGLARFPAEVLVIDEGDRTRGCRRTCVLPRTVGCAAWKIDPGSR